MGLDAGEEAESNLSSLLIYKSCSVPVQHHKTDVVGGRVWWRASSPADRVDFLNTTPISLRNSRAVSFLSLLMDPCSYSLHSHLTYSTLFFSCFRVKRWSKHFFIFYQRANDLWFYHELSFALIPVIKSNPGSNIRHLSSCGEETRRPVLTQLWKKTKNIVLPYVMKNWCLREREYFFLHRDVIPFALSWLWFVPSQPPWTLSVPCIKPV